ncbi:MucR family transcriptional regulator [Methylobacterium nonmethylotrophicum]|uniref:MucR family transcriptional regulator n=1 Tax=Methylobacterium nonmethylotrophicum TaxID=1141884 RepID=A0A4Z0NFR9_9HYPH|nr:MucR family transcriptional regulator [Methylobacterium nonmethylotrophicum]TGD93712.1 MucR family transcriptional regulator [Methylobacterium nonmethylotrophicum]
MYESTSTISHLIVVTSDIVGAYVSNNSVQMAELPGLIASVHATLSSAGIRPAEPVADHKVTAAQIRKSIVPDAIISFLDGKPYKTLKRHLTTHGMTPDEYREKFGLGLDYPMTSASYSAQRSELAKSLGFGQRRREALAARKAEAEAKATIPARRGRPTKAEAVTAE